MSVLIASKASIRSFLSIVFVIGLENSTKLSVCRLGSGRIDQPNDG